MGAFLAEIKEQEVIGDKELFNVSSSKLREFYSSYQSICENFSIDASQYMQIFGPNAKSRGVWDPHESGCINAIEMFAGLIIFSNVGYEEKVKFLYELFDLNEEGFLCYENLVFMLVSICDATCKIFTLGDKKNASEVEEFLAEYFCEDSQVNYGEFIRWSYRIAEFVEFFSIINQDFTPKVLTHQNDRYEPEFALSRREPEFKKGKQWKQELFIDQKYLADLKSDNILVEGGSPSEEFNPTMQWIYGIRIDDIREPIHYLQLSSQKAANEQLLYICGNNVVIFFPKLNTQQFYCRHSKPVSCIEISQSKRIAASGEMGDDPQIHIWDIKSLRTLWILDSLQKSSVAFLKFIDDDRSLVTVGERDQSPITIVSLETFEIVLSAYLDQAALSIMPLKPHLFCIGLPNKIALFEGQEKSFVLTHQLNPFLRKKQKMEYFAVVEDRILILDQDNNFYLWGLEDKVFSRVALQTEEEVRWKVVCLVSSCKGGHFYLLEQNILRVLRLEDSNVSMVQSHEVRNSEFNLDLIRLLEVKEWSVLVLSLMGDLIRIDLEPVEPAYKKYHQIFKLEAAVSACLLGESTLLIASPHFLYMVEQNEKEVISAQFFDQQVITHIHSFKKYYIIATAQKFLILLVDGVRQEKTMLSDPGEIQDIKITEDCIIVAVGQSVLFFNKHGNEYFQKEAKRLKLENSLPVHIGISSFSKIFLLTSADKAMLKINTEVKEKATLPTAKELHCHSLETFYPYNKTLKIPILFSTSRKMFLYGKPSGEIVFYNSLSRMISHPGLHSSLNGHSSKISQLIST